MWCWLWHLYSFTSTGEGTTRKSRREGVTECTTTGNRSHRRPRPCNAHGLSGAAGEALTPADTTMTGVVSCPRATRHDRTGRWGLHLKVRFTDNLPFTSTSYVGETGLTGNVTSAQTDRSHGAWDGSEPRQGRFPSAALEMPSTRWGASATSDLAVPGSCSQKAC